MENETIQMEIQGLKELNSSEHKSINETLTNMGKTLKDHNGRLGIMERFIEQGKGASKVLQWGWIIFAFVVGGFVFPLILKAMGF